MRSSPPPCNCFHEYSTSRKLAGAGNADDPFIHERLQSGCITWADGDVVEPDADGCIVIPSTSFGECIIDEHGNKLKKTSNGCYRLPFTVPEHWHISKNSLVEELALKDAQANTAVFTKANDTLLVSRFTSHEYPIVDQDEILIPQMLSAKSTVLSWNGSFTSSQLTPLTIAVNHTGVIILTVFINLQIKVNGPTVVTPFINAKNYEIPNSAVEKIELPAIEVIGTQAYSHELSYKLMNTNTTLTHKLALGLDCQFTTGNSISIHNASLFANYV